MKKAAAFIFSSVLYVSTLAAAYAQNKNIVIKPPEKGGFKSLSDFIQNALTIAFAIAILVVLVMLIWGAFEWITSGGDKESVGKARGRIVNALIGLAVLAVAYALAKLAAQFLGFDIEKIGIPTPAPSAIQNTL